MFLAADLLPQGSTEICLTTVLHEVGSHWPKPTGQKLWAGTISVDIWRTGTSLRMAGGWSILTSYAQGAVLLQACV